MQVIQLLKPYVTIIEARVLDFGVSTDAATKYGDQTADEGNFCNVCRSFVQFLSVGSNEKDNGGIPFP